jgi:hypothetical protein
VSCCHWSLDAIFHKSPRKDWWFPHLVHDEKQNSPCLPKIIKTYSFHDLSAVLMASFAGSMRGKSTGTPCKPCIFWQPILALFIRIHPQFVVGFPPSFSGFILILGLRLACGSPHSRCSAVGFASKSTRYSEVLAEQGWRGVRSI